MLALTATATQTTCTFVNDIVVRRLSLQDPVIIALSPCCSNIKLIVRPVTEYLDPHDIWTPAVRIFQKYLDPL